MMITIRFCFWANLHGWFLSLVSISLVYVVAQGFCLIIVPIHGDDDNNNAVVIVSIMVAIILEAMLKCCDDNS